jgi:hypothetical protein
MGKIIKKIFTGEFKGDSLEIELNKNPSQFSDKSIHVSFGSIRLELSPQEFIELGSSILVAEKNLKILKKID